VPLRCRVVRSLESSSSSTTCDVGAITGPGGTREHRPPPSRLVSPHQSEQVCTNDELLLSKQRRTHALRDACSRFLRKLVNPFVNWPSSMNRPIKWPKTPNLGS